MYDLNWAKARQQELFRSHTRATEFLMRYLPITTDILVKFLMQGDPEWEYFKYLIRMIELSAGIRKKPNTTERLNSERMFSTLKTVLQSTSKWTPAWELTARSSFGTLREHECVGGEATFVLDREFHDAATGQLRLF